MPSKTFSLVALLALGVVFLVISSGSNVYADGFADKRVRFDGKLTKGQLDENRNMGFSGRAKWDATVAVRFSPIVRAQFSLAPFIETEADGILGSYTITFTFAPKSRGVSYQNLRVKILDREGIEIASSGKSKSIKLLCTTIFLATTADIPTTNKILAIFETTAYLFIQFQIDIENNFGDGFYQITIPMKKSNIQKE